MPTLMTLFMKLVHHDQPVEGNGSSMAFVEPSCWQLTEKLTTSEQAPCQQTHSWVFQGVFTLSNPTLALFHTQTVS